MSTVNATMDVREVSQVGIVDIKGDVTPAVEDLLLGAYGKASGDGDRAVVLNFTGLEYMNSGGIGLLVTLLVRAQRGGQQLFATGLNEHYRQILSLTRLDEAIAIYDTEAAAVAAASQEVRT